MLTDFPPQLLFSSSEKILGGISVKIHHISENVKKRNPEKLTRNTSKKQGLLSIDVKTTKQNLKRFRKEISRGETLEKISEKKNREKLWKIYYDIQKETDGNLRRNSAIFPQWTSGEIQLETPEEFPLNPHKKTERNSWRFFTRNYLRNPGRNFLRNYIGTPGENLEETPKELLTESLKAK